MVLEPHINASKDTTNGIRARHLNASKDTGPQEGWIVRSHIGWRGELSIFYKVVETYPQ